MTRDSGDKFSTSAWWEVSTINGIQVLADCGVWPAITPANRKVIGQMRCFRPIGLKDYDRAAESESEIARWHERCRCGKLQIMKRLVIAPALIFFLSATLFAQKQVIVWIDQEKPIV